MHNGLSYVDSRKVQTYAEILNNEWLQYKYII